MTTKVFELNPAYKPKIIWAVVSPNGEREEFDTFRDMFTETMNTALKDVFTKEYLATGAKWSDELFEEWSWDCFEEILSCAGYRVDKGVK